jgi:aldose 1-epimerase
MDINRSVFGVTRDGRSVDLLTCRNDRGTVLKMMNYGATVIKLEVADRHGHPGNVTLGFDTVAEYEAHGMYLGATIGRFCNRIAGARFRLEGEEYKLAANNGSAHLHGGLTGFDKVIWDVEVVQGRDYAGFRFSYTSRDGEEGYPGNLSVSATYTLNNDNELRIEFRARTDKTTVVNLTNHTYWNLSAGIAPTTLDHYLQIEADRFLDIDGDMTPTSAKDVAGTVMDFTSAYAIGERIAELKQDPGGTRGYDHNYILRHQDGELARAAVVSDPASGRTMEVFTNEPGVQLYTGNFLDESIVNGGHRQHSGFCLETQHFPDSPNRPDFPSVVLEPGETFQSTTLFRFSCPDQ